MKNLLDNPLVDLNGAFAAVASHMAAKMLFELLQTFILLGTLLSSYLLIPLCSFVCPVGALPICDFLALLNLPQGVFALLQNLNLGSWSVLVGQKVELMPKFPSRAKK
jgi:hypothetical protein